MVNKHRIEMLSDAVFAVAMTLLILDIKVPLGVPPGQLARELANNALSWFSFAITFWLASRLWYLQHMVLDLTAVVDDLSRGLTFWFLAMICVLPFLVSLVNHYDSEPFVFYLYFLSLVLANCFLLAQLVIAVRRGRIHFEKQREARLLRNGILITLVFFVSLAIVNYYDREHFGLWAICLIVGERVVLRRVS